MNVFNGEVDYRKLEKDMFLLIGMLHQNQKGLEIFILFVMKK